MTRTLLFALLFTAPALGQGLSEQGPPGVPNKPQSAASKAQIAELIRLLGNEDFKTREQAAADLVKLGEATHTQSERAKSESKDPEVRGRVGEILRRIDLAQMSASEMHVVGLSQASKHSFWLIHPFARGTNWKEVLTRTAMEGQQSEPTPAKRVWELLSDESRIIAKDEHSVDALMAYLKLQSDPSSPSITRDGEARKQLIDRARLRRTVESDFDAVLRRRDFFQREYFPNVNLSGEAEKLLTRYETLTALECSIVNRRLLEAAFPLALDKLEFSLADATVTVTVGATESPINLVLCNNDPVRWVIVEKPGAQIKNVIVGGYELQDVTGVTCPIRYYVYRRCSADDHKQRRCVYFDACSPPSPETVEKYTQMADFLRNLTGMETFSFQNDRDRRKDGSFLISSSKD